MMLEDLLANSVFTGVAGAAVVSGVLFQVRQVPALAWMMLQAEFSATLTVYSEQEAFRQVDRWLGQHPSAQQSRRLALTEWWDQSASKSEFDMTPGAGPHLLWDGGRPIFVSREVETPQGGGAVGPRRQTITLKTLGRSRSLLTKILDEARTVQDRNVVPVHVWGGHGYELVERRPRRTLDSIYLPRGLRERIVEDAHRFVARRGWYADRGVPHRRGYLFEGPPGTGKSSMALALAGELHRAIYVINPSAVRDDNALQTAINQAGSGVVLIEDIDAVDCGQTRTSTVSAAPAEPLAQWDRPTETGISMSGLLNAIDGVAARDGRILIITSNHADRLDPALVRPGRVDMRCEFSPAGQEEAVAMLRRFCPEADERAFVREIADQLPLSQAELQNRLLRMAA